MADDAPPLAGIRVVEQSTSLAAGFAGLLLAELGADVLRIESVGLGADVLRIESVGLGADVLRIESVGLGADVLRIESVELGADVLRIEPAFAIRSPGERVLHRGKRSVTLRPAELAFADVTLRDETAAEAPAAEDAIDCVITAWGRAGHPGGLPPDEPLVHAATGIQATQWSWARRPVWLVTPVASYMAGMLGALGVTAALFARRRGAPGQQVETSAVAGAFALNSGTYVRGPGHQGYLAAAGDPRGLYPTYGLYRTADGWVFVGALTQAFWVKLMTLVERVDLLAHPILQASPLAFGTPEIRTLVRDALEPIFASRPTAAWVTALRDADIPCGPVETRAQFLHDAEAEALGLVVDVDDPVHGRLRQPAAPFAFSATPCPVPRAAPRPGADTAVVRREAPAWRRVAAAATTPPSACLEGIRVLDLTSFIAGPFCPMLLADLGADVVKIESADGDPFRMTSFGFVGWNRGKRSLVLDLKRPEGVAVFLDLVRAADVVVDNFRGGVMERLGIGWDRLRAANARLVHTSITGFGAHGPLAALPGFDPVFQARSGLAAAQGGTDEPVLHVIAYNDYCAGAFGALATVAALYARERTGRGQRVDVSLFRTAFMAQAAEMVDYPGRPAWPAGGRDHAGPSAARRLYACRDGWVCVAAGTPDQAAALGRVAGIALVTDAAADGPAANAVAGALAGRTCVQALTTLSAAGVPAAACLGFEDVFVDPFLRDTSLTEQQHPTLGRLELPGPFLRLSATPIVHRRSAPLLGGDGRDVLREIAYPDAQVDALIAAGVVGRPAVG